MLRATPSGERASTPRDAKRRARRAKRRTSIVIETALRARDRRRARVARSPAGDAASSSSSPTFNSARSTRRDLAAVPPPRRSSARCASSVARAIAARRVARCGRVRASRGSRRRRSNRRRMETTPARAISDVEHSRIRGRERTRGRRGATRGRARSASVFRSTRTSRAHRDRRAAVRAARRWLRDARRRFDAAVDGRRRRAASCRLDAASAPRRQTRHALGAVQRRESRRRALRRRSPAVVAVQGRRRARPLCCSCPRPTPAALDVGGAHRRDDSAHCRWPRRSPSSSRRPSPTTCSRRGSARPTAERDVARMQHRRRVGRSLALGRRAGAARRRDVAAPRARGSRCRDEWRTTCSLTPPRFAPSSRVFAADSPGCRRPRARRSDCARDRARVVGWPSSSAIGESIVALVVAVLAAARCASRAMLGRASPSDVSRARRAARAAVPQSARHGGRDAAGRVGRRADRARSSIARRANRARTSISPRFFRRETRSSRSPRASRCGLRGRDARRDRARRAPRSARSPASVATIDGVDVSVVPPSYAGRAEQVAARPRAHRSARRQPHAADDSRARGAPRRRDAASHDTLAASSANTFTTELVADADGYVAIEPSTRRRSAGVRRLIGLIVIADEPPKVRITAPGKDVVFADGHHTIDLAIDASDDIGARVAQGALHQSVGIGRAIHVQRRRRSDSRSRAPTTRTWTARAQWRLDGLSLDAGDMVVYRAIATDHRPGATAVGVGFVHRRDSRAGRQRRAGILARSRAGALRRQPADGHSQDRASRGAKSVDDRRGVRQRAAGPGGEQRKVRAEFVFMMGGELADAPDPSGDINNLNEEAEAEGENDLLAGRSANQGRIALVRAIRAMSRASTALTNADLATALTHERAALKQLEQAFSRSRILLRALTERERLDLSRRLSGVLTDAARDTRPTPEPEPTRASSRCVARCRHRRARGHAAASTPTRRRARRRSPRACFASIRRRSRCRSVGVDAQRGAAGDRPSRRRRARAARSRGDGDRGGAQRRTFSSRRRERAVARARSAERRVDRRAARGARHAMTRLAVRLAAACARDRDRASRRDRSGDHVESHDANPMSR